MRRLVLLTLLFSGCRSHPHRPVVEFRGWYGQESDYAAGEELKDRFAQELHRNPACSNIIFVREGEDSDWSLAIEMPKTWHLSKSKIDTQGSLQNLPAAGTEICTEINKKSF